ncbi:hypothetical protein [Microbacterium sp. NPDC087665]|uniref:hypothetical protein n=1 Tax=Microbacterium sp. NPDC087665 TaxID=3364194 RepID=UPI0037F23F03
MASIAHARLATYARPASVASAVELLAERARHDAFVRDPDHLRVSFRTRRTLWHGELDVVIVITAPIGRATEVDIWLDSVGAPTDAAAEASAAMRNLKAAERLRRDIRVALL